MHIRQSADGREPGGKPQTWEATVDYSDWEEAARTACELRAPCPLRGYETRSACIVPRARRGKGGRRCQLVLRFQLFNPNMRIDSKQIVEHALELALIRTEAVE